MPLHAKSSLTGDLNDQTFAAPDAATVLPKFKFPDEERAAQEIYQLVHDELMLDGNARQNLATFCQTWEEPEVHQLMDECLDKNMVDKDEYPQTAEIEARCVHMLADLWNSPAAADTIGCSTTGSSEAAMLGGMAMKWRWRAKRRAEGKPTDKPNLVCGGARKCPKKSHPVRNRDRSPQFPLSPLSPPQGVGFDLQSREMFGNREGKESKPAEEPGEGIWASVTHSISVAGVKLGVGCSGAAGQAAEGALAPDRSFGGTGVSPVMAL